jgi:cell division septation protein DedD
VPQTQAAPSAAPTRFHVQLGSFDALKDADDLAQRLQRRGYSTSVTKDAPYRVWVGGYLDRATAERLVSTLQQLGYSATMVP